MLKHLFLFSFSFYCISTASYAGCSGAYATINHSSQNRSFSFLSNTPVIDTIYTHLNSTDTVFFTLSIDDACSYILSNIQLYKDGGLVSGLAIYSNTTSTQFTFSAVGTAAYDCHFLSGGVQMEFKIVFMEPTSLVEMPFSMDIVLYPNPGSSGIYTLKNKTEIPGTLIVQLIDVSGRIVKTFEIEDTTTYIDISECSKGSYSLICTNSNGSKQIKKLIYN